MSSSFFKLSIYSFISIIFIIIFFFVPIIVIKSDGNSDTFEAENLTAYTLSGDFLWPAPRIYKNYF